MAQKFRIEFDDILRGVGSYGRYQIRLTFWVVFMTSFFMAISVQLFVFITVVPDDYWCHVPGRELTSYTEAEWIELTVPTVNGTKDKCNYYNISIEDGEVYINESYTQECSVWDHNSTQFDETVATSKGWLCNLEIYSTHLLSISMSANALGMAILPAIADKITGRRLMFFICSGIFVIFSIPMLISDNYYVIMVTRIFAGIVFFVSYQMPFLICLELIDVDKRALTSFFSFLAWTCGMCANALIAWLIPHWWWLTLITIIPYVGFFGLWWILPESPRYLLFRNKIEECADILQEVARVNKKSFSKNLILKELKLLPKDDATKSFKEMLQYPRLLFMVVILSAISVASFIGYVCVIYNIKVLPNNYFLAHFVLSLFELPSNIIGWLSTHYFGRKYTALVSAVILIPICATAPFYLDEPYVMLGLASLIKVFNAIIIFAIYVITPEVFPTTVRSTTFGAVQLCGTIGIALVPYMIQMENGLHYWILCGLSVSMVIFSLFLPETIGLPLPQTFQEADHQVKDRSRFTWINHWNQNRFKVPAVVKASEELEKLRPSEDGAGNSKKE